MEITFSCLRSKEIVNIYDGKRLGHINDLVFDKQSGRVLGLIVPEPKKMFKKAEDIFIPLELLKKIGDDVILVRLEPTVSPPFRQKEERQKPALFKSQEYTNINYSPSRGIEQSEFIKARQSASETKQYARYKRTPKKLQ